MRLLPLATILLIASSRQAVAQTPPDVSDLAGASGSGGETQLEARGYHHIMTNTVRDTKWSFWWSDKRRQCISVATNDGRYAAISVVPTANCDVTPAAETGTTPPPSDYGGHRGSVDLVCIGSGSGPAAQSNSGYRYNYEHRKFEPEYGTTLGREGFSSDLEVEIADGLGRIRPVGKLVSPIHSGSADGWWPIEGLIVTPDRITGRYRMNGMNKPRIDYDRRTRVIHIDAATEFTGRCEEH